MTTTPLCDAYRRAGRQVDAGADLEAKLVQLCERAEAAWPELSVERERLIAYAGARPACADDPDLIEAEAAAELLLCCACSAGDQAAHTAFDRRYLGAVGGAIAHMKLGHAMVDEIRQIVRHKLLVAEADQPARIDDYAGKGKLAGLVQVVAVRSALDVVRKHKREAPAESYDLARLPSPDKDPELAFIKETYRAEFSSAFEQAVRQLTSRERNLMRMHLLDGVTLEQLADMYDVHRATIVRWLAKARATTLSQTKKALRAKLQVSPEELESLMELLHSRFEVSVERIMQTLDG